MEWSLWRSWLLRLQREPQEGLSHVVQPEAITACLNKINIRGRNIKANCAKNPPPLQPKSHAPPVRQVNRFHNAPRDSRSFKDVLGGNNIHSSNVHAPVSSLSIIPEIYEWVNSELFVGVAKSFDTLCNFPALVSLEGFDISEVKYIGGMNIAVKFKSKRAGEVFKANKNMWLKWFNSVESFDKSTLKFERIVWVKVVGIPPQAWDDSNFAAVLEDFGKVMVYPGSFWNSSDISAGKLCILTEYRMKINEEIETLLNGNRYQVGVMEIEDDWVPFRPFVLNEDTESDESEEDRGDDLEDGEIDPDESPAMVMETPIDDVVGEKTDSGNVKQPNQFGGGFETAPRTSTPRGVFEPPFIHSNGTGFNAIPNKKTPVCGPDGYSSYENCGPRESPWISESPIFQMGESTINRVGKKKNRKSANRSSFNPLVINHLQD
ncbi:hypothetical protein LXL04_005413 [Taraxacum kok-saghyz]